MKDADITRIIAKSKTWIYTALAESRLPERTATEEYVSGGPSGNLVIMQPSPIFATHVEKPLAGKHTPSWRPFWEAGFRPRAV